MSRVNKRYGLRSMTTISELRRGLLRPPDEIMLEVGAVGELLVARVRLVVAGLIFCMPFLALLSGAGKHEFITGGIMASFAVIMAVVLLRLVKRRGVRRWVPFISTTFDITSITLVLALFFYQGYPHTALNSRVVWELYLLSIGATALRGDVRVCLFGGALCLLQYGALLVAAAQLGDLNADHWAPFIYGHISWGDQISRLIIIGAATLLAMVGVVQTNRLLVMSSIDQLTGLRNRAYMDYRLAREMREAKARDSALTLALIDIDHFKQFNDSHGHLAGDYALQVFANHLKTFETDNWFACRYGGEEFALVMPGVEMDMAQQTIERLRETLSTTMIVLPDSNETVQITLSAGIADIGSNRSPGRLLDAADQALMAAKSCGRNQVQLAA